MTSAILPQKRWLCKRVEEWHWPPTRVLFRFLLVQCQISTTEWLLVGAAILEHDPAIQWFTVSVFPQPNSRIRSHAREEWECGLREHGFLRLPPATRYTIKSRHGEIDITGMWKKLGYKWYFMIVFFSSFAFLTSFNVLRSRILRMFVHACVVVK